MTNEITNFAASIDKNFGFSGTAGGTIDIVSASPQAAAAANSILESLNQMSQIAKNTGIAGIAAGLAAYALTDTTTAIMTLGAGGMAGAANSIFGGNKGGRGK